MVTWGKRAALVAAVAVVLLGLGAVLARPAFADASGPAGGMQRFIAKLAANLGIGEEQLQGAIKTTRLQLVDEAVAEGRLTAEQAERARQRIEQGQGFGPMFGPGRPGAHRGGPRGERGPAVKGAGFSAVAQLVGLTPPQLRDELRGKTLAEVGQARGKSRDEVGQAFLNGVRTALDQAVANGRLTRERADAMIQRMQENLNSLLDRRWPEGAPGPRGERGPAVQGAGFSAVAQLLGLTPPQLRDELRGKTLAEVGQARGKSRDEVGQAFLNGVRTALDQAVTNGRLTRERADAMIQRMQENLNSLLDRRWPEGRRP